jgi:hypothetical protein
MLYPEFNTDIVSDEFWKMVRIANWNAVIKGYKNNPIINKAHRDFFKQAQNRIYSKYSYNDIRKFGKECHHMEAKLHEYFEDIWLDEKYGDIMPSDDGYDDLISSVVGKGKNFVKKILETPKIFLQMAKDDDYVESFHYLFIIDEEEYHEIKSEFDPIYKNSRKYNL